MFPNVLDFIEPGAYALLIATYITIATAFLKGWVVVRFVYDKEVDRADKATVALEAFAKVVATHTDAFKVALEGLTQELREWRRG